jgi:acylphosphatase
MKKQVHVYYSGRVQGIGFRFTTERIAQESDIVGWVRNLADGRVELVAEAGEDSLNEFLRQINTVFGRYIKDVQINWEPATGEFREFGVKF